MESVKSLFNITRVHYLKDRFKNENRNFFDQLFFSIDFFSTKNFSTKIFFIQNFLDLPLELSINSHPFGLKDLGKNYLKHLSFSIGFKNCEIARL